ncbi:Tm-1-like ATP-binding domain-containing protein [Feifania hominis]|uniref:Tm-1-like ATP-binding domain-containing protein n=1 Tax=Feifania hominis TaxID=2763660 RepID=A0A926DCI7_9FIRM|nr:Tm-1-like ATP-binding domain-containing protein [Feifania hominis]MBC8535332.1 Tm-1-like ATP-binding domain-containing protein [Feifania hominis]
MKTIAVIGTFDTKAQEYGFVMDRMREHGVRPLAIDVGTHNAAPSAVDITSAEVAALAGTQIERLHGLSRQDAFSAMLKGAQQCVKELHGRGEIQGIFGMGGSGGTTLASAAMRTLPLGVPKLLVSTLAGTARMADYVGGTDIIVMGSIVDISGLNSITKMIFSRAAGVIAGAVNGEYREPSGHRLRIAASMYGVTTPGVTFAKRYLESRGYEVITFHATGSGGRAMEQLIREGFFDGVLDMTLPEIHAHVLGVPSSTAGPERCAGAARKDIPQVVCPGGMDMCSTTDFTGFEDRRVYCHNTTPSHFRPNARDMERSGVYLAQQLNKSHADCAVYLPCGGLSLVDVPGGATYDPEADESLFEAIKSNLDRRVELHESPRNINDESFALEMAQRLDEMMTRRCASE